MKFNEIGVSANTADTVKIKKTYQPPMLTAVSFRTERGFAESGVSWRATDQYLKELDAQLMVESAAGSNDYGKPMAGYFTSGGPTLDLGGGLWEDDMQQGWFGTF